MIRGAEIQPIPIGGEQEGKPHSLTIPQATKQAFSTILASLEEFEKHDSGTIFEAEPEKLSIKERFKRKVLEKRLSLSQQIVRPVVVWTSKKILSNVEKKFIEPIGLEFPEGFEDSLREKMKGGNTIIMIVSNHFDHANLLEMMKVSKTVTNIINRDRTPEDQFKGSRLIIARSLKTGRQNRFLQELMKQAEKDYLPQFNLSTEECISKNDKKRRHMTSSTNLASMRHLNELIKAGNEGISVFVEGNVDGGRFTNGIRNGMRYLDEDLDQIIRLITQKNGKEIVYVRFGTSGYNRIHTDSKLPTKIAWKTLLFSKEPKSLVNIKVAMPITHTEIIDRIKNMKTQKEATPERIRNYLGTTIAELVPMEFRGVYSNKL